MTEGSTGSLPLFWWRGNDLTLKFHMKRLLRFKPYAVYNFGDYLSPAIVARLSGKQPKYSKGKGKLLAIGSVLHAVKDHDTIWGSGLLMKKYIEIVKKAHSLKFCAVRGPRTRALLIANGFEVPEIYGDPALLLPYMFPKSETVAGRIGLVPHFLHFRLLKRELKDPRIHFISPEWPLEKVLREISSCEQVLSTSLHGLIVAESYGIPSLLIKHWSPLHGDMVKFEDYFESTGRELKYGEYRNPSSLGPLIAELEKIGSPKIDLETLLKSFPYLRPEIKNLNDLRKFPL